MNPEAFAARCKEIVSTMKGHEAHRALDFLTNDVLRELGYGEGVAIFEAAVTHWHKASDPYPYNGPCPNCETPSESIMTEIKTEAERVERCETCRFWRSWQAIGVNGSGRGECRRYPPTVVNLPLSVGGGTDRATPVTGMAYWCGEYQPLLTRIKSESGGSHE